MRIVGMALREMRRRRQGVVINLLLVASATALLTAVFTLRDASTQRIFRVMAQMGNNLLFLPDGADPGTYLAAIDPQPTISDRLADTLYHHPVTGLHGTHYVARLQRRIETDGGDVIFTGFRVVEGGHRPGEDTSRRRSFLDDPLLPGDAIVGAEAARRMDTRQDASVPILGRSFRVSQVRSEQGDIDDLRVWANLDEAQGVLGMPGVIHGVDGLGCFGAGPYLPPIQRAMAEDPAFAGLRVLHTEVPARTRLRARTAVQRVGALTGSVVTLLVGLGLFFSTLAEVRSRRSEVGILAGMGAGSGQVLGLFLPKALIVGLVGGGLGWLAGSLLSAWAGPLLDPALTELRFRLQLGFLPRAMAGGALLLSLAAMLAAWRGLRLDPVAALREI